MNGSSAARFLLLSPGLEDFLCRVSRGRALLMSVLASQGLPAPLYEPLRAKFRCDYNLQCITGCGCRRLREASHPVSCQVPRL